MAALLTSRKIPTVRQPTAYRYISPAGEHRASAMRVLEMKGEGGNVKTKRGPLMALNDGP